MQKIGTIAVVMICTRLGCHVYALISVEVAPQHVSNVPAAPERWFV